MTLFTEAVHTIYRTTCLVNGKFYIGYHKTKDTEDSYFGSGTRIINSIAKHGIKNFVKETLFIFSTAQEAYDKEREIVAEYLKKDLLCMNLAVGGNGYDPTEESKKRLSQSIKGRKLSLEHKRAISVGLLGGKRTEAQKVNMRKPKANTSNMIGHAVKEETRKKIGDAHRGKTISKAQRERLSELNLGKLKSEEFKENLRGRKQSKESNEKRRTVLKGRVFSEEHLANVRSSAKARKHPIPGLKRNRRLG